MDFLASSSWNLYTPAQGRCWEFRIQISRSHALGFCIHIHKGNAYNLGYRFLGPILLDFVFIYTREMHIV